MALLSDADIEDALAELPGWTREGDAIRKQFTFGSFPEAVEFVNSLVPDAEAADHHPDLTLSYRRVTVAYSTHSEGGLTAKDVAGAKVAEAKASDLRSR
jgi:4a-hydroxytetrahydrobiopterin dehydratase